MNRIRVAPIVEGQGEYESVRGLLTRVWMELLGSEYIEVLRPIRHKRQQLARQEDLRRAVELAVAKLAQAPARDAHNLVFLLLDADEDLPCQLAPRFLAWAKETSAGTDVICVVANVEYETWFAAAAESLTKYLDMGTPPTIPDAPEQGRLGKGWVKQRFRGARYSETQDQPAMTAAMDLGLCRRRSPSFDKLCREFEVRRSMPPAESQSKS